MTTRLNAPLKRELAIAGDTYTLTIAPEGLKLVLKGKRKGYELSWRAFVSGEAALAVALNASLQQGHGTPRSGQPVTGRTGRGGKQGNGQNSRDNQRTKE